MRPRSESFELVDVGLHLETDDQEFLQEFSSVFGGGVPSPRPMPQKASFAASVIVGQSKEPGHGLLRVWGDGLADPAGFFLAFSSPTVPIRALPATVPGETALGIGQDDTSVLRFREAECFFRLAGRWRRILAHFLFVRLLRLRDDALFFHAASLGIHGAGVLLVGPKGSGKSTLALALAARGHNFLGDETACYLPASGELLPFRRPVGIKPGRRARAVQEALARGLYPADEEGVRRVSIESLLPVGKPTAVPLGAVVFLRGLGERPELIRLEAGREEIASLQPFATSLTTRSATQRVFEMVRLISRVRAYGLNAGDPDETAVLIEEGLGTCP
jgi:hypothetical protein